MRLSRLLHWDQLAEATLILVVSRLVVWGAVAVSNGYHIFPAGTWDQWDAPHYLMIATWHYALGGIGANGNTLAFYPLFPLLIRGLTWHTHLPVLVAGLVIPFAFSLSASYLLYRYVALWRGRTFARQAVVLLAFYPFSVFLSAPYVESILLTCIFGALYSLERKQLLIAAAWIGLACVSKAMGFLLLPILLYAAWQQRAPFKRLLAAGLLALTPVFLFMVYQYVTFNDMIGFFHAQQYGWHKTVAWPWTGLVYLFHAALAPNANIMWRIDSFIIIAMIAGIIISWRVIPAYAWWYSLGLIFITISTNVTLSTSRFSLSFLPFYLLGSLALERWQPLKQFVPAVMAGWLAVSTIAFIHGGWVL